MNETFNSIIYSVCVNWNITTVANKNRCKAHLFTCTLHTVDAAHPGELVAVWKRYHGDVMCQLCLHIVYQRGVLLLSTSEGQHGAICSWYCSINVSIFHTHTHTHMHTQPHTQPPSHTLTHIPLHTLTHIHTHAQTHVHDTYINTHRQTDKHTHSCIHKHVTQE